MEAPLARFADFEDAVRPIIEKGDHANERNEQRLVGAVERRVDENAFRVDKRRFAHFARAVFGDVVRFLPRPLDRFSQSSASARSTIARIFGVRGGYAARISDAVNGFPIYGIFRRFGFTDDIDKGYLGYPPRYAFLIRSDASSAFVVSCSTILPVSIT